MKIMGIDPGLNATGYGVIDAQSERLRVLTAGAVRPSARQPLARRLLQIYDGLNQIVQLHRPAVVVLEALYTHYAHLTTASLMAHARGVACLVSAQHHLELVDYLPTRIKKALTGNGYASKEQVARMVEIRLGRRDPAWTSDATDALALAIAHASFTRAPVVPTKSSRRRTQLPVLAK